MGRIAHISDLHFGRIRSDLVDPLVETLIRLKPDVVVLSGDLTQRARRRQFRAAKAFIDRLPFPLVCVPGNHDVPLENVFQRWIFPFSRYKRIISPDLEPVYEGSGIRVCGINTVNPYSWQAGKISRRTIRRICSYFEGSQNRTVHVVAFHHPLTHPPGVEKERMRGSEVALDRLAECGAEVVLSGHLHIAGTDRSHLATGTAGILMIQAGTGLSDRLKGEANSFNLIDAQKSLVTIERYVAETKPVYDLNRIETFRKVNGTWQPVET